MICYQMVNPSKSFSLEEVSIRWWWWILYSSSWEGQPKSGKDQQWGHKGNNPGLFCFLSSVGIWKVSNMNVKKIVSINSTVSRTTYQTICPPYTVHQQKHAANRNKPLNRRSRVWAWIGWMRWSVKTKHSKGTMWSRLRRQHLTNIIIDLILKYMLIVSSFGLYQQKKYYVDIIHHHVRYRVLSHVTECFGYTGIYVYSIYMIQWVHVLIVLNCILLKFTL